MNQMHTLLALILTSLYAHSASGPVAELTEQVEQKKPTTGAFAAKEEKQSAAKVDRGSRPFHERCPPPPPGTVFHTYAYPQRPEKKR